MATTRRVRANPGQGVRLREEILCAAEALLEETGSEDALTLRAVASRAGVSTPSVYLHFADKEALVEAVCLRVWDELARLMRETTGDDPFRAMGNCGRAYARFALGHPTQYRVLMLRPSQGTPPAAAACFGYMVDAVTRCVEAGMLRGDPVPLALSLWSAVHGCVSLLITHPGLPWPEDLDGFIDDTIRMAGLGSALMSRLPRGSVPSDAWLSRPL
ncbi:TetR/AcrR family transcriptional regulator [Nonomuraea sp. NPDC050556]|uniref:TetR/AcrR family transcriptional regulator n=1 Tax=Nonomuraea sp. NPDC050556 TaxID=3364369 RepID=UPI0037BAA18E